MFVFAVMLQAASPPPIIVEGRRYEDDLSACIERGCPPAAEMELSLQASVQQFTDGRYDDAVSNLRRTISRNGRHAAAEPALLASLHSTLATVARHVGDNELTRASTFAALRVLREHLPHQSRNVIEAALDVADMELRRGDIVQAERSFASAADEATSAGHPKLAALITLRRASLAAGRGRLAATRRLVADAAALTGGTDRAVYEVGEILLHRAAIARGDDAAIDRLVATVRQQGGVAPMLIHQRPLPVIQRELPEGQADLGLNPVWADVGYWVRPGGETAGVEVLRTGSRHERWVRPVLRQIEERRYLARDAEAGDPGSYRIERVTLRSARRAPLGSRIRRAVGMPSFHLVDITHLTDAEEAADTRFRDDPPPPAQNPDRNADTLTPSASTA